ncbi:MAG: NHL repeat-containing protein, partial [Planctomycetaceae bacterium]
MAPSLRLAAVILAFVSTVVAQETQETQSSAMQYPLAVAADTDGVVYVADRDLPGVWKVTDGKPEVFFQASKQFRTPLNAPRCVAIDAENRVLVGDSATREVYRFSADGKPEPLTRGYIGIPSAIAVAGDGTIFVSDLEAHRIWSLPKDGLKEGEEPKEVAVIAGVRGLAFDHDGKLLAVTTLEDQIRRIGDDGQIETVVKGRPFKMPHHLVVGGDGSLFVADNYAVTIWKVPPGSEPAAFVEGEPLVKPVGLGKR